jgi:hypothetical protein
MPAGIARLPVRIEPGAAPADALELFESTAGRVPGQAGAQASGAGIATRYMARATGAPRSHPIAVELLSQIDIVRILVRLYFASLSLGAATIPDARQVRSMVDAAARHVSLFEVRGLVEDDIGVLRDEIESRYPQEPLVRSLTATGYWNDCRAIISHLPERARAGLLSVLWGGCEGATSLYLRAAGGLETVAYASEAYVTLDAVAQRAWPSPAVTPHPASIALAATIEGGFEHGDPLAVRTKLGQLVTLPRDTLALLAAEIRLQLAEPRRQLADLAHIVELPAPGRRPFLRPLAEGLDRRRLSTLFAREKAAYLFQRATERSEISALLVCLDPSGPDPDVLAAQVADWVDITHGAGPAERESSETALFVAATKVDLTRPVADAAAGLPGFLDSLGRMLVASLGRQHRWPLEWTVGQAFDNVFLVPRVKQVIAPSKSRVRLGRQPTAIARSAQVAARSEDAHHAIRHPVGERHFNDIARAIREAADPRDGGMTYLAQSVEEALAAGLRQRQIAAELRRIRSRLRDVLLRRYPGADPYRQRHWRLQDARLAVSSMKGVARAQRFGYLMRAFEVGEDELLELFEHVRGAEAEASGTASSEPGRAERPLEFRLAAAAMGFWSDRLFLLSEMRSLQRRVAIAGSVLTQIAAELEARARAVDTEGQLATRLGWVLAEDTAAKERVGRLAIEARHVLAELAATLGYDDPSADGHPRRKGLKGEPAFGAPPAVEGGAPASAYARVGEGGEDWQLAYAAMVKCQVEGQGGRADAEQERQIGELLAALGVIGLEYEP